MPRPPDSWSPVIVAPGSVREGEVPVEIDALRGDLYRLLDQLARAAPHERTAHLAAFEDAWKRFKVALDTLSV